MICFSQARACLVACVLLAFSDLRAQALTLRDAVNRSLQRNPDLAVFSFDLKAQDGRIQQAGEKAPLELGVLVENALGTGSRSNFRSTETTLSLGVLLDHGAPGRRAQAASAVRNFISTELDIKRFDIAAETARRFITVLEAQLLVEEIRGASELTQQTLTAVEARVKAAKVPRAEADRAQAQVARALKAGGRAPG